VVSLIVAVNEDWVDWTYPWYNQVWLFAEEWICGETYEHTDTRVISCTQQKHLISAHSTKRETSTHCFFSLWRCVLL